MTSAGLARLPYLVQARARVCTCGLGGMDLGRFSTLAKAAMVAAGYWNVYLAFYGNQRYWLHFEVVDLRDGAVVWRDGKLTKEEHHGTIPGT